MTRLNWEANKRNRWEKDYSYDGLYPTGSYHDQKRYWDNENQSTTHPISARPQNKHNSYRGAHYQQQSLPFSEADSRIYQSNQKKCSTGRKNFGGTYLYKQTAPSKISSRANDYTQLSLYVEHARSEKFSAKWPIQKQEIAQCIEKLICKCDSWGKYKSPTEKKLIDLAVSTVHTIKI
jgi:hypothetical protein